ncbi:Alpha/beta hydrolase fold-1 [Tricladium varicosporioides]|nr:Alpha/beta hydrolase fold-1 [Hymenoscyphus varicosporioides]
MEPTILIIPGLWEGTEPFAQLETLLSPTYPITYAPLSSTGHPSPTHHTLDSDVADMRSILSQLIEKEEKEVVMFAHSIGGVLGPAAMEGLGLKERKEGGRKGGVIGIVFLAAGVATEGLMTGRMPFHDIQGGSMYCTDPLLSLFNDFPPALAQTWLERLQPQPAEGWDGEIKYCGWRHVPSVFLVCEEDQVLTREMQEGGAELAGSRVVRYKAGHMAQIVVPEVVAGEIRGAAEEFKSKTRILS